MATTSCITATRLQGAPLAPCAGSSSGTHLPASLLPGLPASGRKASTYCRPLAGLQQAQTLAAFKCYAIVGGCSKPSGGGQLSQRKSRGYRRGTPTCMALAPGDLSPAAAAGGLAIAGFAALRAVVYFRLQYITAAMVARHVPRGGARLVDLSPKNVAGRNLFYLPKDAVQVTVFDGQDKGAYLQELGIRAGVPVDVRTVSASQMNLPPASVDAVVSVYGLSAGRDATALLKEAARVLKPGKPLIFVENVSSEIGAVRLLQAPLAALYRITGWGTAPDRQSLQAVQGISDFESVQSERIWDWQDPHVVGFAMKRGAAVESRPVPVSPVDQLASMRKGKRRRGGAA